MSRAQLPAKRSKGTKVFWFFFSKKNILAFSLMQPEPLVARSRIKPNERDTMHPLFLLAIATFVLVVGFLVWNKLSVKQHPHGDSTTGIGGVNDPLSGATHGKLRDPAEMTASLDEAAGRPLNARPR
jgi:hypothetical protein